MHNALAAGQASCNQQKHGGITRMEKGLKIACTADTERGEDDAKRFGRAVPFAVCWFSDGMSC